MRSRIKVVRKVAKIEFSTSFMLAKNPKCLDNIKMLDKTKGEDKWSEFKQFAAMHLNN